MDLDYVIGSPLPGTNAALNQVAIIRLFGVTAAGAFCVSSPPLLTLLRRQQHLRACTRLPALLLLGYARIAVA